jgi:hypothetical protein
VSGGRDQGSEGQKERREEGKKVGGRSIINFTLLNAAFGSPPLEDLTGQAIINQKFKNYDPLFCYLLYIGSLDSRVYGIGH